MAQILLHKQALTTEQIAKLEAQGVIAIQTDKPKDFQFLDLRVPQIEMNDMVWACLDALNQDSSQKSRFVSNLAGLAARKQAQAKAEG
jgi:hypothetical protein